MNSPTETAPTDRIFLTGGTGYLGKHLVREFRHAGYELFLLTRPHADRSGLPLDGVRYIEGDLLEPSSYAEVLEKVGAVVHSAGLVSAWESDRKRFDRINVQGLAGLLEACAQAHVPRVVYTSSFFTLGPGADGRPRTESQGVPAVGFNDYDRTKILAAEVVNEYRHDGLDVVSVLPTVLYGPGPRTQGNHVATLLEKLVAGRMPGLLGDGSQCWNYVHVADAARGHRLALERGDAGRNYLLGGENRTLREFLELAAELAGVEPPRRRIGFAMLSAVARWQVVRARMGGPPPELTPGMVRAYRHHWAFDDTRAREELGYRSRSLREGLEETLRWLQAGGDSPFRDEWSGM